MNVQIAIPAHVGNDGIWLHFVSPTTGKQSMVHFATIAKGTSGIVQEALAEWEQAQVDMHAIHNPPIASADGPR